MDKARYRAVIAAKLGGPAPIEYHYVNHRLVFTPEGLGWAMKGGEKIRIRQSTESVPGRLITNGQEVEGLDGPELAGKGVIYENAYGKGLHLGVLTKDVVFRKIVRFDRLEALGAVPEDAEVLEVEFELGTEEGTTFRAGFGRDERRIWNQVEPVVTRGEPVELRKRDNVSFIRPAHAWDNAGGRIPLALEFRSEGGRLFLTKLIPVAWLKKAAFPVFADVDLTFGIEATYNAGNTNRMSVTPLDSTRVVIAYEDVGNGSFGTAVVGTISGTTITFGPEWVFNPASTQVRRLSATTLDSSHVVITYRDMANSLFGTVIVGTVSGTTITFGPEWVFNPGDTFNVAATALDSTHVAIAYEDAANGSFGTAIVGTVSGGDTITFGAEYVFEAGSTQYTSAAALDTTHFVVAYRDLGNSNFGTAIVGTVSSGDVIAWGPPAVFNPADTAAVTPTRLDSTRVLIAYGDNGNLSYGTGIVGTVSGGDNLSFGSEVVYNPSSNNGWNVATTLDSNHVVIALAGSFSCCNGVAVIGTISGGNNICFGPLFDYDTGSVSFPSARALDATRVVIAYRDDGSTFGTAIVGETSQLQRLVGFESGDGSEMVSLSLDASIQTAGVRPGSGDYFLEQGFGFSGNSALVQGLATCEGTIGVRFSFRKPLNPSADQILLQFVNGATNLWSLRLRTDGRLQVQQDEALGLITTTGATALADNVWYTVRLVYDRAAGGVLRVWLVSSLQIDATHSAAGTTVDAISVSGPASPNQYHYDDFAITDSISPPKFGQIVRRQPVAAGNLTEFSTPSPPVANYLNVSEVTPATTDFNQHEPSTVATDLYALADSPAGAINGVKGMWQMRRGTGASTGGTHNYAWRENGVNRSVAFAGLGMGFTTREVVWETPPNSGGTWTSAKLDALELGASHNGTQEQDTYISWTTAMVDYDDGTTAVRLVSLTATGYDREVLIEWETASELNNLGFHVYRAPSEEGPYERITASVIPGLGSSPEGARYRYVDRSLSNGMTYFYKLEDIETTGKTKLHGPVLATPQAGAGSSSGRGDGSSEEHFKASSLMTYGNPSANRLEVLYQSQSEALIELITEGFYAEPLEDGTVRLSIPGFEPLSQPGRPSLPVKRPWMEAVAGVGVKLVSVEEGEQVPFTGLVPSGASVAEGVGSREGTVRLELSQRLPGSSDTYTRRTLYPRQAARVLGTGFQGEVKKVQLELAPLRWDGARGRLLLARRLVVKLRFEGRSRRESSLGGGRGRLYRWQASHGRRNVVARLATKESGLQVVRYEEVLRDRSSVPLSGLRLSRLGKPLALHIEPDASRFAPGSRLYFLSEGEKANPYGDEAVYELEVGTGGEPMAIRQASPVGEPTSYYRKRLEREVNRYYQAGLLAAEDLWLWDVLMAPAKKSYAFEIQGLAPGGGSRLWVRLQGASDLAANPDHRIRLYLNGAVVGETSWEGKNPEKLEVEILPGQIREGENLLKLENLGDTGAAYSMVFLDRFAVEYPRRLEAEGGRLEGSFSEVGVAEVSGVGSRGHGVDVTEEGKPVWLLGVESTGAGAVRFRAEAGRSYMVVGAEFVGRPEVRRPGASDLKSGENGADYLVVGPAAFLDEAQPLLELRRSEGLRVKAVSVEQVYEEFGFGEPRPEALREFLSYAYHRWKSPAVRYVLLLGDGTYDFKNYLGTGVVNRVPPLLIKTSYLWTASDPTLAAVNGEDLLPDLALGRLPAASEEEVRVMVEKILAYESQEQSGRLVLVADNPDFAGDFVANAEAIASGVLAGRPVEKLYLSELGSSAMRSEVVQAFDQGASLMSYIGHGGIQLWAQENIFNLGDVASLSPQPQQPLFVTMNCLNGYFHFPYLNALAEAVLKAEAKGAIAAFSPSGLSLNDPAHVFHQALLEEVFNRGHERLGDAVLAAQETYAASGTFSELLSIYHLFGDPALRLH